MSSPELFWPSMTIASWDAFLALTAHLGTGLPGQHGYIARGQADAGWELDSSLGRLLTADVTAQRALEIERVCLEEFKAQSHLHLPSELLPKAGSPEEMGDWLALMQHYHAPTRLLDWTESLFVAAYFAVESYWEVPGAMYVFHLSSTLAYMKEHYAKYADSPLLDKDLLDPDSPPVLFGFMPNIRTPRLIAQQGILTVSTNVLADQHAIVMTACTKASQQDPNMLYFQKWLIPPELKPVFLRRLRSMNITAASLFPGADGLGRSISEIANLYRRT